MRAPEVHAQPRATQVVDRLTVQLFGLIALAHEGTGACLDAKPEVGARGPRGLRETLDRFARDIDGSCSGGRPGQLPPRPPRPAPEARPGAGRRCRLSGVLVSRE